MTNNHPISILTCAGFIVATSLIHPFSTEASPTTKTTSFPSSGKVLSLTGGDLMCYVDIDVRGKKYHLGADFSICTQTKFLNKQVQLTYKGIKVNDCQSSEPCGKTRIENSIVKIKLDPTK
jgi:hypothetical protein